VGARGQDVTPEEGARLVVGFCVMNDWSTRDIQREEMKLLDGLGKG